MVYDHARKVGNRGDVWKHFALLTAVTSLHPIGNERLLYRESHSGRAKYVLLEEGDWKKGIGCILPVSGVLGDYPYFTQFPTSLEPGDNYPGSWLQVGNLLSNRETQFSVEIHDTSAEVAADISRFRHPLMAHVQFSPTDGFEAVLKGPSATFSFIDPPYHPKSQPDWRKTAKCASALRAGKLRFMIWYPIYWPTEPDALVKAAGTKGLEVLWRPIGATPSQVPKGCGVVADSETTEMLGGHKESLQILARSLGGNLSERVAA